MAKYVIVVGGTVSGVGKGVASASMALLMKLRGHTVQCLKCDPYYNVNAGIINPNEHGEVWVTENGDQTDLDLGHYARIAGIDVNKDNICTAGMLFKELIEEQEEGKYLGQTIRGSTHLSKKVIKKIEQLGKDSDIVFVEIGGTVDDAESSMFLEAVRQLKQKHHNDCLILMISPVLWFDTIKEFKTKPLQRSIRDLQSFGLIPDILFCRCDRDIPNDIVEKISELTGINEDCIFEAPDVKFIYQVALEFYGRHVDDLISDKFHLKRTGCRIHKYKELVEKYAGIDSKMDTINVGIVVKYCNCNEAYISLKESIIHAAIENNVKADITWIYAEEIEKIKNYQKLLEDYNIDCLICPGGFGERFIDGKLKTIQFARENKIPYLGICLGLQLAVIEVARNLCKLDEANSLEFNKSTPHPVIHYVEGQESNKKYTTMRLGSYACELSKESISYDLYKKKTISERHRHRYEVNPNFVSKMEECGFRVMGTNPETSLIEIMELDRSIHPFFIGTQAHPEFKSRLMQPAPLFCGLISAAVEYKKKKK